MNDWESILAQEMEGRKRLEERREALWHALERDQEVPGLEHLEHLSGLLEADIDRVRALWNELNLEVRRELIEMLSETAKADFKMDFSAIFRIAMGDEDADIRARAVSSLDEVEDVRLVPAFATMLRQDPAVHVRRAAAEALATFVLLGELQKIRQGPFERAVAALRDSHTDSSEDLDVQRKAVESLAYTGESDVPELISRAYEDKRMRKSALLAMGRSADKRWGTIVRRELRNPDPELRFEATRAAGELQLREAVQDVIELTEDVDAQVRQMALWSLGQIGGNLARKRLQRYIHAEDEALRTAAREALQELEFAYGSLSSFFGPPEDYDGETEELWRPPGLIDLEEEDEDSSEDDEDSDAYLFLGDETEFSDETDYRTLVFDVDDEEDDDLLLPDPSDEDEEPF